MAKLNGGFRKGVAAMLHSAESWTSAQIGCDLLRTNRQPVLARATDTDGRSVVPPNAAPGLRLFSRGSRSGPMDDMNEF